MVFALEAPSIGLNQHQNQGFPLKSSTICSSISTQYNRDIKSVLLTSSQQFFKNLWLYWCEITL